MTCQFRFCASLVLCSFLLASCGGGGTSTATVNPQLNNGDNGNNGNNGNNGDNGNNGNGDNTGNGGGETPSIENILSATHDVRNLAKLNEIISGTDMGRGIAVYRVYETATADTDQNSILFLSDNIQGFTGGPVDESRVNYNEDSGMVLVGDTSFTLIDGYEDEDAFGLLLSDANNELVVVVGSSPYNSLPTGRFRFQGRNVTSHKMVNSGVITHETYAGNFTLDVDFAAGTGSINVSSTDTEGRTGTRTFSGSIVVDATNGTFSGRELPFLLTGTSADTLDPVTISGIFNGDQATGVSGVYYTLDQAGVSNYSGYILGDRTERLGVNHALAVIHNIPLRALESGHGVARYTGRVQTNSSGMFEDGKTILYLGENIAGFVGGDINFSGADIAANTGNANVGTTSFNVLDAKISGNNFALLLVDSTKLPTAVAGGEPFVPFESGNLPTGMVTYTGDNVAIASETSVGEMSYNNIGTATGTFSMNIDFMQNSGSISANSTHPRPDAPGFGYQNDFSGNLVVNAQNGTFESSNLSFTSKLINTTTSNEVGAPRSGTMSIHGNFHGDGAIGVSGAYEKKGQLEYTGYILGTKSP